MKTLVKRTLCMLLSVAMIFAFAACGKKEEPAKQPEGPKEYKIGICNFVDDASLNQIVENIQNTLDSIAKSEGVKFTVLYDNCQTDANVMNQIIQNFIADKVDIMIGIATPIAMGMQAATEDNNIPVVFSAVSDPIVTKIVDSMEKPGKNITGTSDMLNTDSIINMMFAFNPDLKKVGLLYDIGQDSSTTAIANAKKLLAAKGVEVIERTGTNVAEVVLAAEALVAEKVEAIFTPTDNTIMTAELSIYELFAEAGIPHYCGADSFALNGAFLGFGVNYANLGVETAKMAADILLKGADPATMPVKTFDNGIVTLNEDYMEKHGLKLDDLKKAFADYSSSVQTLKTAESF
ncbi:MAG: ABC transporter substrate-binding protein [Clostridia bacterium]|nr:ABC transporter substrate-binding protein [Clostridia bacterium]